MAQGLTTAEVMQRLHVRDPDTVYALGRARKIRGGRLGRQWRWDEDSVNDFIRGGPAAEEFPAMVPKRRRRQLAPLPAIRFIER